MFKNFFSKAKKPDDIPAMELAPAANIDTVVSKNQHTCPVCNNDTESFIPVGDDYLAMLQEYKFEYPLSEMETINLSAYSCPYCNASDRDRLYALYFKKRMAQRTPDGKLSIIDIAPAASLSAFFRSFSYLDYRTADLYMEGVDDKVDITDMNIYADSSFDIFVCSHILEHIEDDRKAMSELFRILKPGGWGIAMVPIWVKGNHVIEHLPHVVTEADRWRYYGQGDHVRMYNRSGFVQRLTEAGFKVTLHDINYFGAGLFEKNGIHTHSVLYIVEKL